MAGKSELMPSVPDLERVALGCVLLDDAQFSIIGQALEEADFFDYKNRTIFSVMKDLQASGEPIDRVTVANALAQRGESEKVTLSYLVELDTGAPMNFNIAAYVRVIAEKSRLRKIILHSRDLYKLATASDAISTDVIAKGQSGLTEIGNTLDSSGQMISQYIDQFPGGLNVLLDPSKFEQGIKTGFIKLDEWTSGIHPKEIFVIGARPSQGKTAILLNILSYIAKRGGFCVLFSLEMSKQSCLNRLMCAEARVDLNKFRLGYLDQEERTRLQVALSRISKWPIYIDDSSGLRVGDMGMRLQSLAREQPVAACGIDFFQLLRPTKGRRFNNENEAFTEIGHDLQLLAKSTGIPLILLSQLNRESEKVQGDKRPRLSQCRGSGTIEEISDCGAVVFREEVYRKNREDLKGRGILIVEKCRNGPTGDIKLYYLAQYTLFMNDAYDLPDEDYKSAAAGDQ
jgi:replicative DNA helicase